jgi:hypothetical protein
VNDSSSAVRLYAYDHPLLARTLRAKLTEEMQKQVLALGQSYAQDWADYKWRTGIIKGLKEAIDICAAEEKNLGD